MKQRYRSILVANERLSGLDVAVDKAAILEHYSGASLTLLEVIYDALEKEPDKILPRADKDRLIKAYIAAERHALSELAAGYSEKVASLETAVGWSESREVGICRYAIRHHMDLIIKPLDPDRSLLEEIHQSSIHRLFAHAPCPVLISKVPSWTENQSILACVDVSDSAHCELNKNIVLNALSLAELLGVPLHLLNVVAAPQLSLGQFSSSFDVMAIQRKMIASREQALAQLRESLTDSTSEVLCHVKSGSLVTEVKSIAEDIGTNIIVMGTAGREGVRRFLIGNSAESLINRVNLDLLCVKENPLEHTEYGD